MASILAGPPLGGDRSGAIGRWRTRTAIPYSMFANLSPPWPPAAPRSEQRESVAAETTNVRARPTSHASLVESEGGVDFS